MAVRNFEDLDAWQRARELSAEIYRVTAGGRFSKDFGLKDQIRRAAVSVMSNIAEGFERVSLRENYRFVCIAKGSAAEVRCQLYVALDVGHLRPEEFQHLKGLVEEVSRLVGGYRVSLERRLRE